MNLLFVGLNTVDLQFFVNGFPKPNTKTKAHENEIAAGGPATNAAVIAAVLGAEVTLISPIGKHSLSRFLIDDIVQHGVRLIDPIENIESKPVFASIITDEINGERTIFSYHPGQHDQNLLDELHLNKLDKFNIALFDGFYPDLAIPIAKKLQKNGVCTVLDGGSWKPGLSELLPYIDIAICSNDFDIPTTKSKSELINKVKEFGVDNIAITRGEDSIIYSQDSEINKLEVPGVDVLDSLGAGDFFHGAFCYYYAQHNDFKLALHQASIIASESCKHQGTRKWITVNNKLLHNLK